MATSANVESPVYASSRVAHRDCDWANVRCGRGSGWRRGPVGAGGRHGGNASFCGTVRVVWKQHSGAARASAVDEPDAEGSTEPPRGAPHAPLPAHSARPRRALTNASYRHRD
ncbi:uncharacterized protein [Choristoneura fumiferana]|uniref:uncharacterized protein n=1 Tax=Choristoneura fumiferana TaxID=7141 RepID=UPI003D157D56